MTTFSLLSRYSVNMSQPAVSTDMKQLMQESLTQRCQQTNVVDDRFASMKRELAAENSATLDALSNKKARLDKYQFKSKGNEQEYHDTTTLEYQDISKAMGLLQEGKATMEARMKLIKLTDKSDHGWQIVVQYITYKLADNSDDEKRIDRAERAAEKKAKKSMSSTASKSRPVPPYSKQSGSAQNAVRLAFSERRYSAGNHIEPCYKLNTIRVFILPVYP